MQLHTHVAGESYNVPSAPFSQSEENVGPLHHTSPGCVCCRKPWIIEHPIDRVAGVYVLAFEDSDARNVGYKVGFRWIKWCFPRKYPCHRHKRRCVRTQYYNRLSIRCALHEVDYGRQETKAQRS